MNTIKNSIKVYRSYYTQLVVFLAWFILFLPETLLVSAQETTPQLAETVPQEKVIDMESYEFKPSELIMVQGQPTTLILRNQSFLVPHNFLLENPRGVRIFEADISSGETQRHVVTLSEPGIYPFYCDKQLLFFPSHREEGMEGRLIVP